MRQFGNYIISFLVFGAFMYYVLPMFRKDMTTQQRMIKTIWGSLVFTLVKAILDFLPPF
ncbi:hypothetical protein [Sporomusa malonica]|uniref:Uncharacterized protein n=1 Tax=Sporomusa malonica TaxID=112901 RepID=A0A1W2F1U6_9FIRM|nr:hypothetical protein [Sporomusa malonica]SMD15895.1 hypothetical protein SAMN04488500_13921 [Sporomusa malonica]